MKLNRETVSTLQEGDLLLDTRNGDKYFVRTIMQYIAWNRPCYRLTIVCPDRRTIYGDLASAWYGMAIVRKAEAFYTGGGIWLSAMYVDEDHYYTIDNCSVKSLWFYDHREEDDDTEYPTQNLLWEKDVDECTKEEQQIYYRLREILIDEMKRCGCDPREWEEV